MFLCNEILTLEIVALLRLPRQKLDVIVFNVKLLLQRNPRGKQVLVLYCRRLLLLATVTGTVQ